MAHKEQKQFCKAVQAVHPDYFRKVSVLDVGSLDINGNNRYLFSRCKYYGIDICSGKNVDEVISAYNFYMNEHTESFTSGKSFDTIISTEMLEHDREWYKSLQAMYELLRPGGLLVITCATTGRAEHGTTLEDPKCSPATNDYYKNLEIADIQYALTPTMFCEYYICEDHRNHDLFFYGIKRIA
jgi:SAM-dependent methyltransferase